MPWSDVFANVWLPLAARRRSRRTRRGRGSRRRWRRSGSAGFAKAYPRQLSGGMKMRVSIARALVTRPQVLLMDEPFAALDEITRLKLNDDLAELQASLNATVVFVTHSVFESVYLADRIVVMAARPGRAFAEINVEAPPIRREGFRLSTDLRGNLPADLPGAARGDGRGAAERVHGMTRDDFFGYAVPAFTLGCGLLAWEGLVRYFAIPPYLLPAPSVIIATLFTDWPTLSSSLWVTLSITLKALLSGGDRQRGAGDHFRPVATGRARVLSVRGRDAGDADRRDRAAPADLSDADVAVLVCAFLVAFFPLLANTTLGLSSADHNLVDLFAMYRASRLQQFMLLRLPSALAVFSRRPAHQRRSCADRRDRRGDRRWLGRAGVGPRLSHRRIGVSAQYSENVRRAALDLGRRHHNSCASYGAVALAPVRLARKRARSRRLNRP